MLGVRNRKFTWENGASGITNTTEGGVNELNVIKYRFSADTFFALRPNTNNRDSKLYYTDGV